MATARTRGAVGFGIGLFAGLGLKYLWEVFRLPGYGVIAYNQPIGTNPSGVPLYVGVDDIAGVAIGGGVAVVGRRANNATLSGMGVGTAVGVLLNKALEAQGAGIIPIACAPLMVGKIPDFTKC